MPASMHDVAARAGVSQRTVSNVVNGYVHVRPETRDRVQRAIEELRYRPNASARSLRESRTGILALAVPEISAPYFAEIADHVQREAAGRGYTLLIDQTGADRERELLVLQGYRTHLIDGLIMSPMGLTEDDLRAEVLDVPTVLLGERVGQGPHPHVAIDNESAAEEATNHLIGQGRRQVAAVGALPPGDAGPAQARLAGYRRARLRAGLPAAPELEVGTGRWWSRDAGFEAVSGLLERCVDVDAIFCFNDLLAMGAVKAIVARGLRVPADIAVVGWDDIAESRYTTPALSTVAPDKAALASRALDLLIRMVQGDSLAAAEEILCPYRLEVRASSES